MLEKLAEVFPAYRGHILFIYNITVSIKFVCKNSDVTRIYYDRVWLSPHYLSNIIMYVVGKYLLKQRK